LGQAVSQSLSELTEFTIATEYGGGRTTLTVHARSPVALLHRAADYDSRAPFQVMAGARLDELVGHVSHRGAWAADRTPLGTLDDRSLMHSTWTFTQHGLGVLHGSSVGVARAQEKLAAFGVPMLDLVVPKRFRFRSAESAGFELVRPAGPKDRFRVHIHDPRVDRLLVLACVASLVRDGNTADLRKFATELTPGRAFRRR
jgi:hypothetical protein